MQRISNLLALLVFVAACGGSDENAAPVDAGALPDAPPSPPPADAAPPAPTFGGDRPAVLKVPPGYDPQKPTPLVVALHGYSATVPYAAAVFGLAGIQAEAGFLLIEPKGTKDQTDQYFWNATDACCNFYGDTVDDVQYLNRLVDDISAAYNVDPRRIYVVGHSNGGFMSYRLACESAGRFAAIVSVAGASYENPAACAPAAKIHVLQIHGTGDETIKYTGGALKVQSIDVPYPAAVGSVDRWASYNGCAATRSAGAAMDLTGDASAETEPAAYDACPSGGSVELWTMNGLGHLILFRDGQAIWGWLAAHPKP